MNARLTQVNVWNRPLSTEEASLLTSSCHADVYGNVVTWDDVTVGREEGAVLVVNSTCDGDASRGISNDAKKRESLN